jgi:tetratricopeptide (TPR) repeat protein
MGATTPAHLAVAEWLAGMPERAARTSGEALEIARRVAHPLSLNLALAMAALQRVLARDWETTEALAAELREAGVRYGIANHVAYSDVIAGPAVAARGDTGRGVAMVRAGWAALRPTGWQCVVPLLLAELALAVGASGDTDAALEGAAEALRMTRANGELAWESEALRVLGEVKRAAGAPAAEAEADLREAVEVARRQGALSFELRAATSPARPLGRGGRAPEAHDLLAPVYERFTEASTPWTCGSERVARRAA